MPITLHTTLRTTRVSNIATFIGTSGKLRMYTAAYATLLVECLCSGSAFAPDGTAGVLTANAIADGTPTATGTAVLARLYKSDGTTLAVGGLDVTGSGGNGHVKLGQSSAVLTTGVPVQIHSCIITDGNA